MKKRVWTLILIPFLLFYALPVGAAEKEERKWQDETIYFLMVDRFNNGDSTNDFEVDVNDPKAYNGGDFQGIIERLDYIKDMGFTSISLTSVFKNEENGYHGYWIEDFYETEEHFGTMDKFKELVKEAHDRDMKVIIDFVANNVGPNHQWVKDPEKSDWFHEKQENINSEELEDGWIDGLPDLNHENQEVKDYLIDAAKWWIEETDIDGYRLDAVNYVPESFWAEFVKAVKGVKENFYLLGDVQSNDSEVIAQYEKTGIDGFVNYPLNDYLRPAFAEPDQSLDKVFRELEKNQSHYENPYLMGTIMDNHNTVRFTREPITKNQHPGPRWKLALTYLYTTPGIPIVYYGSEIALDGGLAPDNRKIMDFRTDQELVEFITKIGDLRKQYPSLTRGTIELLKEEDGFAVYKRTYENEIAVIAINNTTKSQTFTMTPDQLEEDKELRGVLIGDLIRSDDKGNYKLIIDRDETEVYILAEKSGLNIPLLASIGVVWVIFGWFIYILRKRSKRKNQE